MKKTCENCAFSMVAYGDTRVSICNACHDMSGIQAKYCNDYTISYKKIIRRIINTIGNIAVWCFILCILQLFFVDYNHPDRWINTTMIISVVLFLISLFTNWMLLWVSSKLKY